MSNKLNQANKEAVWDFWQKLNHVGSDHLPAVVRAALHDDVNWNVSAPIDQILGVDALIADFWLPLLHAFPDLKRAPDVFMGGIDESSALYATEGGEEWVSGCGYFTGTFMNDWLGIPASGKKTNIWFGVFYVLRAGKIAETYLQLDILAVMRQAGYQVLPPAHLALKAARSRDPCRRTEISSPSKTRSNPAKACNSYKRWGGACAAMSAAAMVATCAMEQGKYWHPDMKWYGPSASVAVSPSKEDFHQRPWLEGFIFFEGETATDAAGSVPFHVGMPVFALLHRASRHHRGCGHSGIGGCFTLEEYEDFHQRPWLEGFGDRNLSREGSGRRMGRIGEGRYCAGGIWDTVFSRHNGTYVGIPATGKLLTLRDFDWWKRDGEFLIENWVPIDMIDLFRQMDIDLMARLRLQIEDRKRGLAPLW